MPFHLPMIDVNARWTGVLACLDADAQDAAGDDWQAVVDGYVASGASERLSRDGCRVTLRPLSAAEESAAEEEAGPSVALAGFIYRDMMARGIDLNDTAAVARAAEALPEADRVALHRHGVRHHRLREARVKRALVAADFAPDGKPSDVLAMVAEPVRGRIVLEIEAHLDRISTLTPEGKAPAGEP
jgi:hypothetical protein